jgi:hypothetical protein
MNTPINHHGRTINDLDILKLQIAAMEVASGDGFCVVSGNGVPLVGFLPHEKRDTVYLVARKWK